MTKKIFLPVLSILFLLTALWGKTDRFPGFDQSGDELDRFIIERLEEADKPGLSAVVVRDGDIILERSYGYANLEKKTPVTPGTLFTLGSLSKTIVAVAFMQLYEQGLVGLDEDINTYLPFEVRNPYFKDKAITARMLLTHTSSIGSNWPGVLYPLLQEGDRSITMEDFVEGFFKPRGRYYYKMNFVKSEPGTAFNYSNPAVTLLAYIVAQVSGQNFDDYCIEHIFGPLGMDETSFFSEKLDAEKIVLNYKKNMGSNYKDVGHYYSPFYPAAWLITSAPQLASFLAMAANGGEINGARILKEETVEIMMTVQEHVAPKNWDKMLLIWQKRFRGGRELIGFTGGIRGVSTMMFYDVETKTAVILLMNGEWKKFFDYDRLNETPIREILFRLFEEAR